MNNLNKFDIDCRNNLTRPVYEKRYKKNGEEYLKKVDEIDIEKDLEEKYLEITRLKELINTQDRIKEEEWLDELTEEEIKNLEDLTNYNNEIDTYEFLNKTAELKEIYNKFPEDIKKQYNNLSKFAKEYLPTFINDKLKEIKTNKKTNELNETKNKTFEDLQKQIEELQNKIGGENNVSEQ